MLRTNAHQPVVSRPITVGLAMLFAAASLVAALAAAPPARGATHSVQIGDGFFSPANLTITVGDTVTWTNVDDSAHTATADGGGFDSGTMNSGGTFSQTFTSAGTFSYVCEFHDEMVGTITVLAAAAPVAPAAPAPTAAPGAGTAGDGTEAGPLPNTAVEAAWEAPPVGVVSVVLGLLIGLTGFVLLRMVRRAPHHQG